MMLLAFACYVSWVIDGDTFVCRSGVHVRLAGIDAPEIEPCAKWRRCTPGNARASLHALIAIAKGRNAACEDVGRSYDRVLAFCRVPVAVGADTRESGTFVGTLDGRATKTRDLSCAQVQRGYAVRRYSFGPEVCARRR